MLFDAILRYAARQLAASRSKLVQSILFVCSLAKMLPYQAIQATSSVPNHLQGHAPSSSVHQRVTAMEFASMENASVLPATRERRVTRSHPSAWLA